MDFRFYFLHSVLTFPIFCRTPLTMQTRVMWLPGYLAAIKGSASATSASSEGARGHQQQQQQQQRQQQQQIVPKATAEENATLSRMTIVVLFTGVYGSVMACAWFRLGCKREAFSSTANATARISTQLGACVQRSDSWISLDSVLDSSSTLSSYIRSLHFVAQTLFTVGFGDIYPVSHAEHVFAV